MAGYPSTLFRTGVVDPAFGGQPANRAGAPTRAYIDDQIRAIQQQGIDDQWSGAKIMRVPIFTGCNVGDAIVFDTTQALGIGKFPWRKLATGGFTQDVTILFGIAIDGASANAVARVCFWGALAPTITGLAAASGRLTIDTGTGKLRLAATGEQTHGFADSSGNAFITIPSVPQ